MKSKLSKLYIVIIAFMCATFICGCFDVMVCDIHRDAYVMTNSVLCLSIMSFELILAVCVIISSLRINADTRSFSLLIFAAYISSAFSFCSFLTYGLNSFALFTDITNSLSFIFSAIYWLVLWHYIRSASGEGRKFTFFDYLPIIWISLYISAVIINFFVAFIYEMKNGVIVFFDIKFPAVFWLVLYIIFFVKIITSNFSSKEKWSLVGYIILPFVVLILSIVFYFCNRPPMPESVTCLCGALSLYIIFFNMFNERGRSLLMKKNELIECRLNTMILQANPHFIYNTLGSIEYFCDAEPEKAKKMILDFTNYLRANSESMTKNPMVTFKNEIDSLETYINIERVRFPGLDVEFDIKSDDFSLPYMSVQPLVENAIKHGIGKKYEKKGKIIIQSEELEDCYKIHVIDDGVGFSGIKNDGVTHLGIQNVRERLEILCGGILEINGIPGQGTHAEITIPKEQNNQKKAIK